MRHTTIAIARARVCVCICIIYIYAYNTTGTVHTFVCTMPLEYFCEIQQLIACCAGGADADMDGLLEDIALRDAAALENAFYDLKGLLFSS